MSIYRPTRLCLLFLALALPASGLAEDRASALRALARALPGKQADGLREVGVRGLEAGFGATLRAADAQRSLLTLTSGSIQDLAQALRSSVRTALAGPVHRELEGRHLIAGEAGAALRSLAHALEAAAGQLELDLGDGGLRQTLTLSQVLEQSRGNLQAAAKVAGVGADQCGRSRRALARMLGFVETIQDQEVSASRERVSLSSRAGAVPRLARGLEQAAGWLNDASEEVAQLRSLLRVRYQALLEILRNMSVSRSGSLAPAGLERAQAAIEQALKDLREALLAAEDRAGALAGGPADLIPALPPLPEWLFSPADPEISASGPPAKEHGAPILALLDELEAELTADTELYQDPLTAALADGFHARHGLPLPDAEPLVSGSTPELAPASGASPVGPDIVIGGARVKDIGDYLDASLLAPGAL